jgi:hypothetical protein
MLADDGAVVGIVGRQRKRTVGLQATEGRTAGVATLALGDGGEHHLAGGEGLAVDRHDAANRSEVVGGFRAADARCWDEQREKPPQAKGAKPRAARGGVS